MTRTLISAALFAAFVSCGSAGEKSAVSTCLSTRGTAEIGACATPTAVDAALGKVDDIFIFDLEPSSDANSLQAALYWGMETFYAVGGGDTGLTIESPATGMYSMESDGIQLTCLTLNGQFACGFTMASPDLNPQDEILELKTTTNSDSIQSAALQFLFVYLTVVSEHTPLNIGMEAMDEDTFVISTSTAIMTSSAELAADELSINYSLKIELLSNP